LLPWLNIGGKRHVPDKAQIGTGDQHRPQSRARPLKLVGLEDFAGSRLRCSAASTRRRSAGVLIAMLLMTTSRRVRDEMS